MRYLLAPRMAMVHGSSMGLSYLQLGMHICPHMHLESELLGVTVAALYRTNPLPALLGPLKLDVGVPFFVLRTCGTL